MALILANDVAVISASILMPLYGTWSADIVLDQPDGTGFEAGTAVSVKCDGGLTFEGTVVPDRSGNFLDAVHVRLLAGKAGMTKDATVQGYVQPGAKVQDVLNKLASDAGETLSSQISTSVLTQDLQAWATMAGTVSEGLIALLDNVFPTFDWRLGADGKLWIGEETWPTSQETYSLIRKDPTDRSFILGVDVFNLVPGIDLDGVGKINRIEHRLDPQGVRSHVWTQIAEEDRGIAGAIQALARQEAKRLDYFAFYDAKVSSQSSDGKTVDLEPGDARIPKLQRVPLREGLAGTVCKVATGCTVRLGWDRGNPQFPFACLWQGGETVSRISIAGDTDAARKGDHSDAGTWVFTFVPGPAATLSIVYTDPDGNVTTLASGSGTVLAKAKLTEGSSKVGLG